MQTILVLGAGRSSVYLIDYLLKNSVENDWKVIVADISIQLAKAKVKKHERGEAVVIDIHNEQEVERLVDKCSIVVSLLPPAMHFSIARVCLKLEKNLLTASYTSPEMQKMNEEVRQKGLLFLNEMGLDPGIDHMSAMKLIDKLKNDGLTITSFKSYCGGLIAPESDTNPWYYKFTWNPKNIVLAGQGTAKYLEDGIFKYVPYHQLYKRIDTFYFNKLGEYKGYINRDSLKYQEAYGLENVNTLIRGTLRKTGFCKAWDVFVQLGMTDDTYDISFKGKLTKKQFLKSFLPSSTLPTRKNLAHYLNLPLDDESLLKIGWLGFFEDEIIETEPTTPANILLKILEEKWKLEPEDKDMVIMQHQIVYQDKGKDHLIISSLVETGIDQEKTAMAKTVGLPLGIACKLILQNKLSLKGVQIPTAKEIYEPVLQELKEFGINFKEEVRS
jgi:saccharopine dehydrogenase-like NADP-dependent oxidoreductase